MKARRRLLTILLSTLLLIVFCGPLTADVAYIFKRPSGNEDVSFTFSYDKETEAEILSKIGVDGHIILWQIQCVDQYVFYRPFVLTQGRFTSKPVFCLIKKYYCQTDGQQEGFVYQGYIYLEPVFDLSGPINITLVDKTLQADFLR